MKPCPFCAEEIQDAALKCKHCGEFLGAARKPSATDPSMPWYFKTPFTVLMIAGVGPLALPLIWWRPRLSKGWKIGLTIVILLLTWLMVQATMISLQMLNDTYDQLMQGMY